MNSASKGPVVVGVGDRTEVGRLVAYAAWEARRRGVPVRLVYAESPLAVVPAGAMIPGAYPRDIPHAHEWLHQIEDDVRTANPDVPVESTLVTSGPAGALVAESDIASLVVMGTHASFGAIGHLRGSYAAQVASHAAAPVVVLRPAPSGVADIVVSHRPVVVGVDGSTESEHAIVFALDEADARGAPLRVVCVWDPTSVIGGEGEALELLASAADRASRGWPDAEISQEAVRGLDPVASLAQTAADASLLVVGSRGRGGFLGLRLGSTVDGLIRCAPVPLAVVRDHVTPPLG